MSHRSIVSYSGTRKPTTIPKATVPKVKVAVSSVAAQVLAFRQLNEWKDGPRDGQESVVLPRSCSSIRHVRTVLKGSRKRRSERYDEELSSDNSSENCSNCRIMNETMNSRMQLLIYENQVMKAQLRQYRTKQRKIQRLCCAAIYRDDYLSEVAAAG